MGGCIRKGGYDVSEIGSSVQPPSSREGRGYLEIQKGDSLPPTFGGSDLLLRGEEGPNGDFQGRGLDAWKLTFQKRFGALWQQRECFWLLVVLSVLGAIAIGAAIRRHHAAALGQSIIGENCQTHCDCEGGAVMCSTRILWNARHVFKGNPNACAAAYDKVLQHCPCCSVCPLEQVPNCAVPSIAAEQGCEKRCDCAGGPVTCRARVLWSAQHIYTGNADSCLLAHGAVSRNCPCCAACPLDDVGCG
mmetsp:Transcript_136/g.308  ORF Transcript_136/g.308 Transcript_136/m.308 type:complete len:247 (+) Transcript_136:78-818(+)